MNDLDSLFQWFGAATVRGGLLALAILAVQAALGRWLPARWRYALWLPVICVLSAPALPRSAWSIENWFAPKPPAPLPAAFVETAVLDSAETLEQFDEFAAPHGFDWWRAAQIGWLAGAAGFVSFALVAYFRAIGRMRRGARPADAELLALLDETAKESGLPRAPRLLVSSTVHSPGVCGFLRPLLLLPAGFPSAFSEREARLVLVHELTHLRRHDLPINWVLALLQAVHWCNPVLWFAFARMRGDREAACDAQVLSASGEDRRADYGHALLKLESALAGSRLSLGFVGIFERAAGMRARLRAIAAYQHTHPAWGAVAIAVIAALAIAGATRAQAPAPASNPDAVPRAKLERIIVPKVELRGATVQQALDYLQKQSVALDPAKTGVRITPTGGKDTPASASVTLALTNVPLFEALKYVTNLPNLNFRRSAYRFPTAPLQSTCRASGG
jgi:beta-lactamase regulating signal transducer with metallopeptidase domain